ncbi:cuticle protein 7 [Procambarus clarkii]|uniref:cuticle protein 7 n=1 Tax=Procambarus clarkii TaxID=6728 RepID=UPI00374247B1
MFVCISLQVALVVMAGVALTQASDHYRPPSVHSGYKQPGMPHDFQYNVKDDYSGTNFGHSENSDGNTVRGSYNVDLPDGRKQTVQYEADHYKGYVANVEYKGEAQHPHEYGPPVTFKAQPSYPHQPSYTPKPVYPQPSYTPEPAYKPQPSYN